MVNSVEVFVEIPKGSRNKYEYDEEKGILRFDRMLFSSVHYPADYGFIVDTLAEDGDALDALVLVSEPTFPGCHIECIPVAVFKMVDEKGPDDKVLCVPCGDPGWTHIRSIDDVPGQLLREIENFFKIYKELEEKQTHTQGWLDRDHALECIDRARERLERSR